jgi:peptidylprolyl isomerase
VYITANPLAFVQPEMQASTSSSFNLKENNMAKAKEGDQVKVHYTGKLKGGEVFDSSENAEPLEFTIGNCEMIPGFENAVIGMEPGETKIINLASDDAYGPHNDAMVMQVPREEFPQDLKPEIGLCLQGRREDGQSINVIITGISESNLTLDANHPLAGKDLTFDIRLVEIVS